MSAKIIDSPDRGHIPFLLSVTLSPSILTQLLESSDTTWLLVDPQVPPEDFQTQVPKLDWYPTPTKKYLASFVNQAKSKTNTSDHPGQRQPVVSPTYNPPWGLGGGTFDLLNTPGWWFLPKLLPRTNATALLPSEPLSSHSKLVITATNHAYAHYTTIASLSAGSPVFLNPSVFPPIDADLALKVLRASFSQPYKGPDVFCAVPLVIDQLSSDTTHADEIVGLLGKFKAILLAGSIPSVDTVNWLEKHKLPILHFISSTETSPLMSSASSVINGPAQTSEWQWFREDDDRKRWLRFEPRDAGLEGDEMAYELIVMRGYPTLNVSNRSDGGYDTRDLYLPHPNEKGKWKYLMRKDDVLAHSIGIKTNPLPSESSSVELLSWFLSLSSVGRVLRFLSR